MTKCYLCSNKIDRSENREFRFKDSDYNVDAILNICPGCVVECLEKASRFAIHDEDKAIDMEVGDWFMRRFRHHEIKLTVAGRDDIRAEAVKRALKPGARPSHARP